MSRIDAWERDIAAARLRWQTTHAAADFEAYGLACAAYLSSADFAESGRHWFSGDTAPRDTAVASLIMFSFRVEDDHPAAAAYNAYDAAFSTHLAKCRSCAVAYELAADELVEELRAIKELDSQHLVTFYRELARKDRERLGRALEADPQSVPALAETLWSFACMTSAAFVPQRLIEPSLITPALTSVSRIGACPGIVLLSFNHVAAVRRASLQQLQSSPREYVESWSGAAEQRYSAMLANVLKRNTQGRYNTDFAWYTAATLIKILRLDDGTKGMAAPSSLVLGHIGHAAISCMESDARGRPAFGAHLLVLRLLRLDDGLGGKILATVALEKVLDYATTTVRELRTNNVDEQAPAAARESTQYRSLDGAVIIDWMKLYLDRPGSNGRQRISLLLELDRQAFVSEPTYHYAARSYMRGVADIDASLVFALPHDLLVRLSQSYMAFHASSVNAVWRAQLRAQDSWSPLWERVIQSPRISIAAASHEQRGFIVGMLQSSREVAVIAQVPPKNTAPKSEMRAELVVKELLELLTDTVDTGELRAILLDEKDVLPAVLYLSISGNRGLSLSAEEFIKQAMEEDSREDAVVSILKTKPGLLLEAIDGLLKDAGPADASLLAILPGLLKLSLTVLDGVYSPQDGIETTGSRHLLDLLRAFWDRSWRLVANVMAQIRPWSEKYSSAHVKAVLSEVLGFSQALLSKFRLLDADLSAGIANRGEEGNFGARLAEPVMSTISEMGTLLKLAIPDLLAAALSIIVEILGLMQSFKVQISQDVQDLFMKLASREMNSKLSYDQLRELLGAMGLDEQKISDVVDKPRSPSHPVTTTLPASSAQVRALAGSRPGLQKSIGDFFQTSHGQRPTPIPRQIIGNQVQPQTPQMASSVSVVRALLNEQRGRPPSASFSRPGPRAMPSEIHPERPPGFNKPKKPAQRVNESDDDDDGDGDDEEDGDDDSALKLLGAKKKEREEAAARLRAAFEQSKSKSSPAQLPVLNGPVLQKTAREDRERELRMIKAGLNVKPTELYQNVLDWDYYASTSPIKSDVKVPDTFQSADEYKRVMAPLLYLEAWEQIKNVREEARKNPPRPVALNIGKRVKVDGFTDIYVSMDRRSFAEASLGEGDLLVVTYDKNARQSMTTPTAEKLHCFGRIKEGTVRNAPNASKSQLMDFQLRLNDRASFLNTLYPNSVLTAFSAGNLRTIEREFTALMALQYYPLQSDILKARPSIAKDRTTQISRLQRALELNTSQATAVSRALDNQGFTLIQGPPGTGKTKTILSTIGAFFTNNAVVAHATGQATASDKRILVCAPSNAAVDEIVVRLKNGVTNGSGEHKDLNILRIGRLDMMSEEVRDVSLDEKIAKAIDNVAEPIDEQLRKDHTALTLERNKLRERLKRDESGPLSAEEVQEINTKLVKVSKEIREKNYALDMQRDRLEQAKKKRDARFRQVQNELIQKAQVVCTTLSASAHPVLASAQIPFETVIIDEAAQSIELSALIPLKYGCKQCIMVGDPNQLPPTVVSQAASSLKYEQSLFVRMYNQYRGTAGAVSMLDTQFRMHPSISKFPSAEFYGGKLKDGEGLREKRARPWHKDYGALGPYRFFDVAGKHEKSSGHSLKNHAEAKAALALVKLLLAEYEAGSMGVISPYKEQVRLMRSLFVEELGSGITSKVDFRSIDGFQGQEKDVIVMSCVRASSADNSVGFVGDVRRMNVAITRAKSSMWILGHANSLKVNPVWAELILNAQRRNCLVDVHKGGIVKAVKKSKGEYRLEQISDVSMPATTNGSRDSSTEPASDDSDISREQSPAGASPNPGHNGPVSAPRSDAHESQNTHRPRESPAPYEPAVTRRDSRSPSLKRAQDYRGTKEPKRLSYEKNMTTPPPQSETNPNTKRPSGPAHQPRAKTSSVFIQPRRRNGVSKK